MKMKICNYIGCIFLVLASLNAKADNRNRLADSINGNIDKTHVVHDNHSMTANQIVYICSYNADSRTTMANLEPFVQRCNSIDPTRRVFVESLEYGTRNEISELKMRMKTILAKYTKPGQRPAIVVLIGREAVSTYISLKNPEYKNIPIVLGSCSANIVELPDTDIDYIAWKPTTHNISTDYRDYNIIGGVLTYFDIEKNCNLIKKMFPNVKKYTILTDNSLGGISMQALVRDRLKNDNKLSVDFIDGRVTSYSGVLQKIRKMKEGNVLLIGTWRVDCNNNFSVSSSTSLLRESNPKLPIFTIAGVGMDNIAIGGYFPDFRHDGEKLADICMKYLETLEPQGITYTSNSYNFDYRRLNDFNISASQLPDESNVINKPESFFEVHKEWFIGLGIFAIILLVCQLITIHFVVKLRRMKSALQTQSQELVVARDRAEESNRMKTAFLANMSHEIRTPLNSIVGFSNLLTSDQMVLSNEEKRHFSEIIKQNSDALLTLINDVLDLSRIESGKLDIVKADCDVVKLCKSVVESMIVTCKKPLSFVFQCDKDSMIIFTDEARLRQVLVNLFTNSIKFSEEGTIKLTLEKEGNCRMVRFSLSDEGCGIPVEEAERVFERFVKLDQFTQGTGIGLQLCQQFINILGGKIWVDTTYTSGAKIIFTHPIK